MTYKKNDNVSLSPHFNLSEFSCPCPQCTETVVDPALIDLLEKVREKAGALKITSGYRCEHYQTELRIRGFDTATGISQHQLGRAADFIGSDHEYSGVELEKFARDSGFKAVGVGRNFIHADLRNDKDRRWTYNY